MPIGKKNKLKGISVAFTVSGFQSLESILLVIFGVVAIKLVNEVALAGATMLLKEMFSLLLMLITSSPLMVKNVFKKINSRQGVQFVFAAIIGTSLGNFSFLLAVFLAGSGYGAILTALYPVITIAMLNFIIKEKEPLKVWFGVALTTLASALFVLLPAIVESKTITMKVIVGMILGGFASLFWAIEGVLINIGLNGKIEFTNKEVMAVRSFFTALTSACLITPLSCAFGANAFGYVSEIMRGWQSSLLAMAIGVNIFLLRMASIYSIRLIGTKITSIIDTFNFILPAVLTEIFAFLPGQLGQDYGHSRIIWWAFIMVIPIIVGVFIAVYYQKPYGKEKKEAVAMEPN